MSFLEELKNQANMTTTLNGAKTHATTGDGCLDLFSVAGGMRYRKKPEQIRLFDKAYIEKPDLAMKLLFHIRDIRGGMGERTLFRNLLRHVAFSWPESAGKNAVYVAEYGRWDDLLCLLGTPVQNEAVRVIHEQLDKDLDALERRRKGETDAPISLLAKWMPSANASSRGTREQAVKLMKALDMDEPAYRRMLSALRANIALTERYLTRKQPEKICYEAVPAGAVLKYRSAFERQDGARFSRYLSDVSAGKAKMHADTLFPYEILRPFFSDGFSCNRNADGQPTLEALWRSMSAEVGSCNAISVIDTSGSMYCGMEGAIKPALMAQAMGLYCAERCKGLFHNMFITFTSEPSFYEIHGKTLAEKLRYISGAPWGWNTNLEAVFELILNAAVKANAPQEEMPEVLYIFSDMEFDQAVRDPDKTVYENAREMFEAFGYQLPAVVFHNVNSWQMQAPVTAHTRGAALTSGSSVSALKEKFDDNVTPMSHMLRVLLSDRYKAICA
ncbi:MAG: DUF2828 family protein [Clostridia bacterium]|nr:DUF2828 family protein [Clostridia bacterium]